MAIKASRVQSPSSINTYKQCPRKYYYQYIAKLPTKQNIHTIRGSIVHSVLEDFFDHDIDTEGISGDKLLLKAIKLFEDHWEKKKDDLDSLGLDGSTLQYYYDDSKTMVIRWVSYILSRLNSMEEELPEAFNKLKPIREQRYKSEELSVMGFIDAIEEVDGKVRLIDYKTSKADKMTDEYKLQLGIYALLYKEKHDVYPDEVGLFLLKHGERMLAVTDELVRNAKFEIENIHMSTQSRDMRDYPKKPGPLCNFCDFYHLCFPKSDENKR